MTNWRKMIGLTDSDKPSAIIAVLLMCFIVIGSIVSLGFITTLILIRLIDYFGV